jgi:hypothetical protein
VSWRSRDDGMVNFRVCLPPEEAAVLIAEITAANDQFGAAAEQRTAGECATADHKPDYSAADALLDVARGFLATAPEDRSGEDRTMVVVHVAAEQLAGTAEDQKLPGTFPRERLTSRPTAFPRERHRPQPNDVRSVMSRRPVRSSRQRRAGWPATRTCWERSSTSTAMCWRSAGPGGLAEQVGRVPVPVGRAIGHQERPVGCRCVEWSCPHGRRCGGTGTARSDCRGR